MVFHVFDIGKRGQMEGEVHERCREGDKALVPTQLIKLSNCVQGGAMVIFITLEKPTERGSWR